MRRLAKANLELAWRFVVFGIILGALAGAGISVYFISKDVAAYGFQSQLRQKLWRVSTLSKACYYDGKTFPRYDPEEVRAVWVDITWGSKGRRKELCDVELEKLKRCLEGISGATGQKVDFSFKTKGRESTLLGIRACDFTNITFGERCRENLRSIVFSIVGSVVLGSFGLGLLAAYVLWLMGYPHSGWRRMMAVVSAVGGGVAGCAVYYFERSVIMGVVWGLVLSALLPMLIIWAREIALWIKRGFSEQR